jgi:hypothetical protein
LVPLHRELNEKIAVAEAGEDLKKIATAVITIDETPTGTVGLRSVSVPFDACSPVRSAPLQAACSSAECACKGTGRCSGAMPLSACADVGCEQQRLRAQKLAPEPGTEELLKNVEDAKEWIKEWKEKSPVESWESSVGEGVRVSNRQGTAWAFVLRL